MNRIIILNGPSCAGKTTIAKEICKQSNDKFVHLQVDVFKKFLFTIIKHEDIDNLLGRKICNRMLITSAMNFLDNGFNVVIDTTFNGDNAKEIAKIHIEQLTDYKLLLIGIDCPLEERLRIFKEYNDNPVRSESDIIAQSNVFELCKEFYDVEFDSSKTSIEEIATEILSTIFSQTPPRLL
jgi:chloramphenicol 3-O phosphotransferase